MSEISESDLERQQRELAEDSIAVNEEFERYINAGAIGEDDARLNDLDLIRYWQVSFNPFQSKLMSLMPCKGTAT